MAREWFAADVISRGMPARLRIRAKSLDLFAAYREIERFGAVPGDMLLIRGEIETVGANVLEVGAQGIDVELLAELEPSTKTVSITRIPRVVLERPKHLRRVM